MKLIIGKYSGFCNGVKYTVDKTIEVLKDNKVYSLGEIVHNEVVVNDLEKKGLIVKNNINDIPDNSKVIIRAHGEPIETYEKAKQKNIELIDLTCGKVKLIHNKIIKNNDCFIIIIGKKDHPETIAHNSYSNNSFIIENNDDINTCYNKFKSSKLNKIYVVSQTTFNDNLFDELVSEIKNIFVNVDIIVDKTICNATTIRQEETKEIAKNVDKMIVIGGKNSSNTKELEVIAKKYCNNVYLIQSVDDLDKNIFKKNDIIGITAGASTPEKIIEDVVKLLRSIE